MSNGITEVMDAEALWDSVNLEKDDIEFYKRAPLFKSDPFIQRKIREYENRKRVATNIRTIPKYPFPPKTMLLHTNKNRLLEILAQHPESEQAFRELFPEAF
uniref:Uncharacterized protein n=1 Tax=viral metagenome TaxID=1070528 RepID=A0A6M3L6Z0_9ZZZZ